MKNKQTTSATKVSEKLNFLTHKKKLFNLLTFYKVGAKEYNNWKSSALLKQLIIR